MVERSKVSPAGYLASLVLDSEGGVPGDGDTLATAWGVTLFDLNVRIWTGKEVPRKKETEKIAVTSEWK